MSSHGGRLEDLDLRVRFVGGPRIFEVNHLQVAELAQQFGRGGESVFRRLGQHFMNDATQRWRQIGAVVF